MGSGPHQFGVQSQIWPSGGFSMAAEGTEESDIVVIVPGIILPVVPRHW